MKALVVVAAFTIGMVGFGPRAHADAPKEHSMTGCLAKGDDPGTYKLTNVAKGPSEVVIAESTPDLAPHVGHKVEITGVAVPGKDKVHTMKVTAMKHIAAKCP